MKARSVACQMFWKAHNHLIWLREDSSRDCMPLPGQIEVSLGTTAATSVRRSICSLQPSTSRENRLYNDDPILESS